MKTILAAVLMMVAVGCGGDPLPELKQNGEECSGPAQCESDCCSSVSLVPFKAICDEPRFCGR